MAQPVAIFQPEGRRTRVGVREDLLDAARRCGVGLEDLCAGRGTCGKCRVLVRRGGDLLRPQGRFEAHLTKEDRARGIRLACQCRPAGEGIIVLEIPPESQRSWQRLQTSGLMPAHRVRPDLRKVRAPRPLTEAQLRAAGWRVSLRTRALLKAGKLPASDPRLLVRGREVLGCVAASDRVLGMAFDIGSTKIAGFLMDLETGEGVETVSAPNPQMVHGEDIMSRLAFARASASQEAMLHDEVLGTLNDLTRKACGLAHEPTDRVFEVVAVGNTAMHHLFLGEPTESLSRAPYRPATRREEIRTAGSFGLRAASAAPVIAPPVVAAFVGSDLVAGVLSTRLDRSRALRVFIDVGTNTEICAGDGRKLVACSTPSGPAFEGAHIRFGMRAADGAVERVAVEPETFHVDYRVIGRMKPRGLCGSALLDLLADLFRTGAIDAAGRLQKRAAPERIRRVGRQLAFRVVPADETSIGQDLLLTQDDIGQLQLAKAAIHAGIDILLDTLRRPTREIATLYLAGAFGSYLAPESARAVGMLPDMSLEKVQFVGNTAGSGARLALLSVRERENMRRIAKRIRHVPLAGDPRFPKAFASSLFLPHRDASRFPSVRQRREGRRR
ncbi:MAG TPA: ASKHA domain-containing protein [Thermoplasmata archaeon]|nr:ASKHA domain-containing protein [Thermoplasmata archaeon]